MSVYKEGFYAVRTIESLSRRVYPDAADFGVPVQKGDKIWNLARQAVEMYGVEGTRKVNRYSTGVSASTVIELMDEWNTGKTSFYEISYTSARGLKAYGQTYDGYISIEPVAEPWNDDKVAYIRIVEGARA